MTIRRKTREVKVGPIGIGSDRPVRIQSMTTTDTRDVEATVDQIMQLADAGCEIARITVQGMKEAEACESIKSGLIRRGYCIPLVADIHFFPPAALRVVDFVEKVRINPGNFADKRASFRTLEYDNDSYQKELEKIEEKFTPLVEKCKRLKRAMRIGTNHGSLSDRIMNRYGDTPEGMLRSALEFAEICRKNDYHDFLFSMKSSNPKVMIRAYRLLVDEMTRSGWDYPLHLGVTEAGEGEDGRIKSAIGIGSLLLDGIGDTVRVSLTEDPVAEIDPCRQLIAFAADYAKNQEVASFANPRSDTPEIRRRSPIFPKHLSLHRDGTVIVSVDDREIVRPDFYSRSGFDSRSNPLKPTQTSVDCISLPDKKIDAEILSTLENLRTIGTTIFSANAKNNQIPLLTISEAISESRSRSGPDRFSLVSQRKRPGPVIVIKDEPPEEWDKLPSLGCSLLILAPEQNRLHTSRQFFDRLQKNGVNVPVILQFDYSGSPEELVIRSAAELGALLCDGYGEGIWLTGPYELDFLRNLSFNILQAAGMRTFKTDFISCPSCGRTLFDLQDVSKRIREKTSHLPGVKIAIMGCIVNGPGEMADADFGYVGSKAGMIDLYVGKKCVEKNIPFHDADERLIELIKSHGRWIEPEVSEHMVLTGSNERR